MSEAVIYFMNMEVNLVKKKHTFRFSPFMMELLMSPRDRRLTNEAEDHLAPLIQTAKSSSQLIIQFDKFGDFEFNWDWEKNWFTSKLMA